MTATADRLLKFRVINPAHVIRDSRLTLFFIPSRSFRLPHHPAFIIHHRSYTGRFSLFLYYVRFVSPLSCFSSGTSDFLISFGFMKLLLRGNVVSCNGTLIILNRSASTFGLNGKKPHARLSSGKTRKKKQTVEPNATQRKTILPKRNIVFVEYLVDCTDVSLFIDVCFMLRVTNGRFDAN